MAAPISFNNANQTLTPIACTLGDVSFQNMECPNDEVDYFGGIQKIVKHEFPGGYITTQTFGGFPPEIIRWTGQFFQDQEIGGDMYDRIDRLQQMRVAGEETTLIVGHFSYQVLIHKLRFGMKNQHWIPYTIELVPTFDLNASTYQSGGSTNSGGSAGSNAANPGGSLANNGANPTNSGGSAGSSGASSGSSNTPITQLANSGGTSAPTSSGNVFQLSASSDQIGEQLQQSTNYPALPAPVVSSLTTFQQNLNNAIQQALTNRNSVNSVALQASLNESKDLLQPLIGDNLSGNAAFSVVSNAILDNVAQALKSAKPVAAERKVINPDLNQLAIEYYGDASLWQAIAAANRNYLILTPNPVGDFSLIIPNLSSTITTGSM